MPVCLHSHDFGREQLGSSTDFWIQLGHLWTLENTSARLLLLKCIRNACAAQEPAQQHFMYASVLFYGQGIRMDRSADT